MGVQCVEDVLRKFHVDANLGFVLPDPLTHLSAKFQPWQSIVDDLPALLESNRIDERIASLPIIATDELQSKRELRLAHLLLVTLAAAHVWNRGPDKARLSIPAQIAVPLVSVSDRLGLKPIVCHASACLANWKRKPGVDKNVPFRAENVSLIAFRFTDHPGNEWFFTLTAQMETELAPGLVAITSACCESRLSATTLPEIHRSLATAAATFQRMKERLPADVFYHGFRHFLSGYTAGDFVNQGGINLEGKEERGVQLLNGGSAAQSSALHVYDAFLGVKHSGEERDYLEKQWDYMPPEHRQFIIWVREKTSHIEHLKGAPHYAETIAALRHFRCEHIKVVTSYIVSPAKANNPAIGTGGTSFMKLLKTIRDDC
ncbi:Indoleamine 2,3-dioxygenase 1 [Toxocara canis]|uniref:Indoleamine 2,3-dioxygenase 1 n=1 Tax=Toxocara canis TaxID=6265 RepID=A0A0B2V4F3_TOXCA|nr:Indoleamine 2,3-dioxygenase 1 [Toxocara canis]